MTEPPQAEELGPKTLNPYSASCLVPAAVGAILVVLASLGLRQLHGKSGEWALASARNGLAASGLPADTRVGFAAELDRLESALDAGDASVEDVVKGVAGLLETATVPLLVLDDVRTRRLSDSGLDAASRESADETLARAARFGDTGALTYGALVEILGELTAVPDSGEPVELDDDGLRALVERADTALAEMREARAEEEKQARFRVAVDLPGEAEETPTRATLLARYREHVARVLRGESVVLSK